MAVPVLPERDDLDARSYAFVDETGYIRDTLLIDVTEIQSAGRAEVGTIRFPAVQDSLFTKGAFFDDSLCENELGSVIRTRPRAVPASDTTIFTVIDGLMDDILMIGPGGTVYQAERILTMVARQRKVEHRQRRMLKRIVRVDFPPRLARNAMVLNLASHNACMTADTFI